MFPFSTLSEKDYENLLSVYIDTAFYPLLRPSDFKQEIWDLRKMGEDWQFTGKLYNEMKTAAQDPNSFTLHMVNKFLFEGSPYQFHSGGDMLAIPELVHDEVVDFHRRFYNPSNATFMMYGDLDIEKYLCDIDKKINKFEKIDINSEIDKVIRRENPIDMIVRIPTG